MAARFMVELSDAIENYISSLLRWDVRGLNYRGADLREVVSRWLYFALVNDEDLYGIYRRHVGTGEVPDLSVLPTIVGRLVPAVIGKEVSGKSIGTVRRLAATLASGRSFAAQLLVPLRTGAAAARIDCFNDARARQVLFHLGAAKFQAYLAPIAERFGARAAYLVINDPELTDLVASTGAPVISVSRDAAAVPSGYLAGPLLEWTSTCCDYDMMLEALSRMECMRVVIAEGNSPMQALVNRSAQQLGIRTICVQQGWSPINHSGFRNLKYDAMCVWGKEFARMLRPYNRLQAFMVTGSHVLSNGCQGQAGAGQGIGFFLQNGSRLITEAAWNGMLELVAWCAQTFPDREILVREHPGAPLSKDEHYRLAEYANVRFVPAAEAALAEVLAACRVAVAIFSTTLVEAAASGVIPLIVNMTGMLHYSPDLHRMGGGVEVSEPSAARAVLPELLGWRGDEIRANLPAITPSLFSRCGNAAIDEIERVIEADSNRSCKDIVY